MGREREHSGNPGHAQNGDFPGMRFSIRDLPHFGHVGAFGIFFVIWILFLRMKFVPIIRYMVTTMSENTDGFQIHIGKMTINMITISKDWQFV